MNRMVPELLPVGDRAGTKTYSRLEEFTHEATRNVGVPSRYRDIDLQDWSILSLAWICCGVALIVVFSVNVAAWLGETYQLIAIGFLLAIMARALQGRAMKLIILFEVLFGESSLQNLEAVMKYDALRRQTSVIIRTVILFFFALPLGLSAAYKSFSGGLSMTTASDRMLTYGMTPPPTIDNLGWGLSLFSATMLPYWSKPMNKHAYGYSMWIENEESVAMVDSPLDADMRLLQSSLAPNQFAQIRAKVTAVHVAKVLEFNSKTIESVSHTDLRYQYLNYNPSQSSVGNNSALLRAWLRSSANVGSQEIYADCHWVGIAYNLPRNNTFFLVYRSNFTSTSAVERSDVANYFLDYSQGFLVTLKTYSALWNVTRTTATLLEAVQIDGKLVDDPNYNAAEVYKQIFQSVYYAFETVYSMLLPEFDWRFPWARFDNTTCTDGTSNDIPYPRTNITTDAAFIAAVVWSRVTTKWGPTSPEYRKVSVSGALLPVTKYVSRTQVFHYTRTLRRHWGLAAVIVVLPVLTTVFVLASALPGLRGRAPISNGFGLKSMLAAVDRNSLSIVKGAGYSGELSRKVYIRFENSNMVDPRYGEFVSDVQAASVILTTQSRDRHHGRPRAKLQRSTLCR